MQNSELVRPPDKPCQDCRRQDYHHPQCSALDLSDAERRAWSKVFAQLRGSRLEAA